MINRSFFLILISLLIIQCKQEVVAVDEFISVVKDGNPTYAKVLGKDWNEKPGFLEQSGMYNELFALKKPVSDEFEIYARLSLEKIDGSTALFSFFNNHFGFDSSPDENGMHHLFIYSYGKEQYIELEKSTVHIRAGVSFDFKMKSKLDSISFIINDQEVVKVNQNVFRKPFIGGVGFRPWRNTMRIYDFQLKGEWTDFPNTTYVYENLELGYSCFRNPALVQTQKGTILAFAQGRYTDCYDLGDRDLLVKRSTDNGRTWGKAIMVFDDKKETCTGPVPVVDQVTGDIHLVMTKIDIDYEADHELGLDEKKRGVYYTKSADDGLTWSEPLNISTTTFLNEWEVVATGPGSGIQLTKGAHKNKLIIPCYHRNRKDRRMSAHMMYSDDHGKTWKVGAASPQGKVTECQVAELQDGRVFMCMRQENESIKRRQVAISKDAGMTWQEQRTDSSLVDDGCQGSLAYAYNQGQTVLILANPVSAQIRERMSLTASFDDGLSWQAPKVIHEASAGYSDLLVLDNQEVACFYEHGWMWPTEGLMFEKIPLRLLKE